MADIEIQHITFGDYGDCIRVTNGIMEFVATLEIGPRIIRFGKVNGENVFCEKSDIANKTKILTDYYGEEKGYWNIYGGHRLWTSPEVVPRTTYPDNRPVKYEIIENGVVLIQEPQVENGVQLKMVATMSKDGVVTVEHYVTNIGPWPIQLSVWPISAMKVGGLEVIPQSKRNTSPLHNRSVSLWAYSDMSDDRVEWLKDYIFIRTNDKADNPFKIGTTNDEGYVCYFNDDNLFIKFFDKIDWSEKYPDNNVNYETYACKELTELETLGKLTCLKPGETSSHTEKWQLIPDVKRPDNIKEFEEIIKNYI